MKTNKYILTLALTVCCALGNLYAINSSYYNSIDGKKDSGLRNALYDIIKVGPTGMSYDGLWTAYTTTDVYPSDSTGKAGKIWDMYSNVLFTAGTNQCGSYSNVGDCYNREHSLPKSWFSEAKPAYYDLGHIVPTDGYVNNQRSNYAFGECASGTRLTNGNKKGLGKLGTSTFSGYTNMGKVFEPDDIYKGDFARMYMYMVVRYKPGNSNNVNLAAAGDGQKMFNSTDANYGLTDYSIALLMKWHRNDPVSQKEIDRNNGMQTVQGNRNPFIDYPCLAEYLWGNKAGETVSLSSLVGTFTGSWTTGDGCPCGDVPAITLPTGDIFVGSTEANSSVTKTITVQGVNLTGNLTLLVSGTNSSLFSLSATSIQKTYAEAGCTVTITYNPTAAGNHSATLTISGGGLTSNRTFALSGTCCNPYIVTLSRNGITETVGACGTYTLPTAEDEADACDGWEFKGWVTSGTAFEEGQTTAPTYVTEVRSATTLYAVYGKGSGSSGSTITLDATTDTSFPKDGITLTTSSGVLNNGTDYRIYKGATLTIASSVGDMSSIAFTFNGTYDGGGWATSYTPNSSTWTSPACTSGSSGKQARITQIVVTVGSGSSTTYKKLPCTTYTISYADAGGVATGGTYSANVATALASTTITLDYDEEEGYEFAGWTVTKASGGSVTVTNGQFTMPEANVTVQASFTALCSKLSAPDVTATPGNGQITLTWEDVTDADHYTATISKGEGYTTECSNPTIGNITHSGTTNTCVITGLTNGLEYTTYVVANGVSSICDSDADEDTATPSAEIPTEVTVTFNANGGEGTMSNQTIRYNEATALTSNTFTRTGYTFQGWATEQSGAKVYNDGASVTLTEDITLYAVWQINSHNVTFTQPTSGGTFTVNSSSSSPVSNVNYGSTVTIVVTPTNSHFTVNSVTVSGASSSVAVSGEGNTRTFTMSDEDVTVAVTMNEDPKYIVNWYVSGTATPEQNYAGETLAGIGTPSIDCNGKVFQGWTATANYSHDTDAPTDLFTDASTKSMPSNNNTSYYAVFATVEEDEPVLTNNYQKITSTSELTTGNYLIVADHSSTYKAMSTTWKDTYYLSYVTVTPSNDIITTTDGTIIWNIIVSNSLVTIYNEAKGYLYIAQSGTYYNIKLGENTTDNKFTYSVSDGNWLFTSVTFSTRVLEFYKTKDRWAYHTSADAPVYLYKQQYSGGSTTYSGYTTSCTAPTDVTVTFNANYDGADPATATQTIPYNEETALDANTFSRTGYHFTGWNTATDGSGAAYTDEAEVTLTKDMTLYAQWAKNSYNVSFTPTMTGATITVNGQSTSPQSVAFESEVTIAVMTDVAYAVDEVSVVDGEDEPVSVTNNGDGTYTFTMPASAVTVTVTLTAQPLYTIRFIDNGAVISTQEVFDGQSAVKPSPDPTPCDEKYTFEGWANATLAEDSETNPTLISDFTASANQDYYAVYSYSDGEGGGGSTDVTFNFGYEAWGKDAAFSGSTNDEVSQEDGGITVTYTRNSGSLYANTTSLRFYKTNELTFDAGDKTITAISFTGTIGKEDITTDVNTCTNTSSSLSWEGEATSVTFTRPSDAISYATLTGATVTAAGGGTTYYTTAPDCEAPIVTSAKMLVVEYGGARVALAHDNTNIVAALPMMYFNENYICPDKDKQGNPASAPEKATLTWQVAERTDGYYIKSGDKFLAATGGAFTLQNEKFLWSKDRGTRLAYNAEDEKFVADEQGDLPSIMPVEVPTTIYQTSSYSQRSGLTIGYFGTICLPHAVALPFTWGVKVYSIKAKKMTDGLLSGIYIVEETEMLTAGKPYLIEALATNMTMWYPTDAETVDTPVEALGLVGNLDALPVYVPEGCYGLSDNKLRRVGEGGKASIKQYRAYIKLDKVPEESVGTPMQSVYKVLYTAEEENVATNTEQLFDATGINWNEPVYNILGIRVDRNCTGVLIQNGKKFLVTHPRP